MKDKKLKVEYNIIVLLPCTNVRIVKFVFI